MEGGCILSRVVVGGAGEVHLPDLAHIGRWMESLKRLND
jgi:hypothetical protein